MIGMPSPLGWCVGPSSSLVLGRRDPVYRISASRRAPAVSRTHTIPQHLNAHDDQTTDRFRATQCLHVMTRLHVLSLCLKQTVILPSHSEYLGQSDLPPHRLVDKI